MKKENSVWNPHTKTLSFIRVENAVKHCEINKQVVEYKLFCMEHGLHKNNLNSLSQFCKQNASKAGA